MGGRRIAGQPPGGQGIGPPQLDFAGRRLRGSRNPPYRADPAGLGANLVGRRPGPSGPAIWHDVRPSALARGRARSHARGRRPRGRRVERRRRERRRYARQQPVALSRGRRALGPRRHRDLRRAELLRVSRRALGNLGVRAVGVETDDRRRRFPRPSRRNWPVARRPANWSGSRRFIWSAISTIPAR